MAERIITVKIDLLSPNAGKVSGAINKELQQATKDAATEAKRQQKITDDALRYNIKAAKDRTKAEQKEFDRQTKEAERYLKQAAKDRERIARESEKAVAASAKREADARIREAKRAANEMIRSLNQTAKTPGIGLGGALVAGGVGGLIGGAVYAGISRLTGLAHSGAAAWLDYASGIEQAKIGFTTMIGSAAGAEKHLRDLQAFAASTPFQFAELVEASQKMQGVGISADRVIPILKDVGNALSAAGRIGDLPFAIKALGDIQAKGKLAGQEIIQLANAGIPIRQVLAQSLGVTQEKVIQLGEEGKISAELVFAAIHKLSEEKFGGAMEAQAKTFKGALSNIEDALLITSEKAFRPLYEKISRLAVDFSIEIQGQQGDFSKVGETIGKYIGIGMGEGLKQAVPLILNEIRPLLTGGLASSFSGAVAGPSATAGLLEGIFGKSELHWTQGFKGFPGIGVRPYESPGGPSGWHSFDIPKILPPGPAKSFTDMLGAGKPKKPKAPKVDAVFESLVSNRTMARFRDSMRKLSPELRAQIMRAAEQYGIPESLAFAQLFSESTFNVKSTSPQGAVSIAQGMPGTLAMHGYKVSDVQGKPGAALQFYGKEMSRLFRKYGDWELSVLAYHQGEGTVDKLVSAISRGKGSTKNIIGPKGVAYLKQIKGIAGISGDAQFTSTFEADAEREVRELLKLQKDVAENAKELGLSNAAFFSGTKEGAEASLKVLQNIKSLTSTWTSDLEKTNQELWELQHPDASASEKLQHTFDNFIAASGVSIDVLIKLQYQIDKTKERMDALDIKTRLADSTKALEDLLTVESDKMFEKKRERSEGRAAGVKDILGDLASRRESLALGGRQLTIYQETLKQIQQIEKINGQIAQQEKDKLLSEAANLDYQEKIQTAYGKLQSFFERTFDTLRQGGFKALFKDWLHEAESFLFSLAAKFAASKVLKWLLGGGQNTGAGGLLRNLLGIGGQGGRGGSFINNLFGLSGQAAGAAPALGSAAPAGGYMTNFAGLAPMLGGFAGAAAPAAAAAPVAAAGLSGTISGTVSAGTGVAGGLFGGMGSALGSLFTNPWTAVAAAGIVGGLLLWKHFKSDPAIKKLKEASMSEYGLTVSNRDTLRSLKSIGEAFLGKGSLKTQDGAKQAVHLDESKEVLRRYAAATGQKAPKLDAEELADPNDPRNNLGGKFGGFRALGGPVVAGFRYVVGERGPEMFAPKTSGTIIPNGGGAGMDPAMMRGFMQAVGYMTELLEKFDQRLSSFSPGHVVGMGLSQNPRAAAEATLKHAENDAGWTEQFHRKTGQYK